MDLEVSLQVLAADEGLVADVADVSPLGGLPRACERPGSPVRALGPQPETAHPADTDPGSYAHPAPPTLPPSSPPEAGDPTSRPSQQPTRGSFRPALIASTTITFPRAQLLECLRTQSFSKEYISGAMLLSNKSLLWFTRTDTLHRCHEFPLACPGVYH